MTELKNETDQNILIPAGESISIRRMLSRVNKDGDLQELIIDRVREDKYGDGGYGIQTVECCPECGDADIRERKTKRLKWRCAVCGYEFEDPNIRTAKKLGRPKTESGGE